MSTLREHDRVVLTTDLPEQKLTAGDVGTIVHVHRNGAAFEVEFVALDGETCAVVLVERNQLRAVQHKELAHARRMA